MANKPKRRSRRFRRYLRGKINLALALGTLGSDDVIAQVVGETVKERTWISSVKSTWVLADLTLGEGPITVGIAHGDYTAAEIEEFLENAGSWNEGDLVNQEISKRKIRIVGSFSGSEGSPTGPTFAESLFEGMPITTKCGWILNAGETLDVWAFNKSGGSLTTGGLVRLEGHANLWPQ